MPGSVLLQENPDLGIHVGEQQPANVTSTIAPSFVRARNRHLLNHEGVDAQEDLLGANMWWK